MKYRREPEFKNFGCRKKEGDGRSLNEKLLDFLSTPTLIKATNTMKKLFLYALALFSTLVLWSFLFLFIMKIFGEDPHPLLQLFGFFLSFTGAVAFFKLIKKQLPPWYEPEEDKPDDPEKLLKTLEAIKQTASSIKSQSSSYGQNQEFSPYSHYDTEERRWRIVGTNHEEREEYILKNRDVIRSEAILSREFALDKDPNAIAAVHNGKVLGFIAREHAAVLAPVFDKYHDKINYSFNLWIGRKGQLIGLFVRIHTRFKVAKSELNDAVKKCEEIAYRDN